MCCINIRNFVDQFYQFVEGVPHRRAGIDEVLRRVSLARGGCSVSLADLPNGSLVPRRPTDLACLEKHM